VNEFIDAVEWRFAKTMPRWPHWYVVKDWYPDRESEFIELVRRIFEEGQDELFAVGLPYERTVRYLYAGDYKYWVMDPTVEETTLINRARVDGKGPTDLGRPMLKVNLDEQLHNADWLRSMSWDLPRDKDEFLATIGNLGLPLEDFMKLPAAQAMPGDLRAALMKDGLL
jgi:hypothetical protein